MATKRELPGAYYYNIALPSMYVSQLEFLAHTLGLGSDQMRYIELPSLHEPTAGAELDELDMRPYAVRYDSFATWEMLHGEVMRRLVDDTLQALPVQDAHSAA
jgi:hypothetical protein